MQVSLSQAQTFRECEMKWYYRTIEGIQPREVAVPLELGTLLHQYLASYYEALKQGERTQAAHEDAYVSVMDEWEPKIIELTNLSYALDRDDTAEWLLGLTDLVKSIITRYHTVRGRQDAEDYEVLHVEVP